MLLESRSTKTVQATVSTDIHCSY